jgi:hypothetical protein
MQSEVQSTIPVIPTEVEKKVSKKSKAPKIIKDADLSGTFMRTGSLEEVEQLWLKDRLQLTTDFKRKKKRSKALRKKNFRIVR